MIYENENNIDFEYEKKFLEDYLFGLKLFKPFLYSKIKNTGMLANLIAQHLGKQSNEFYLASFYANIGLSAVSKYVEYADHLTDEQIAQIKRHPVLSSEYLQYKGLHKVAEIVYAHHELPNGSGYYALDSYPDESAYINIADVFQGLTSPKPYRPPHTFREAVEIALAPYRDGIKISREEVKEIEKVLRVFYNDLLEMS